MLEIVIVCGFVVLWLVFKSQVVKINVHLDDDLGFTPDVSDIPSDFVIQFQWKKGRKRISSNDFARWKKALCGRQFPLSLQIAGSQITVIVDFCVDGVPSYVRSGMGCSDRNATVNTGSRFLDAESVGIPHQGDLDSPRFVSDKSTEKSRSNA